MCVRKAVTNVWKLSLGKKTSFTNYNCSSDDKFMYYISLSSTLLGSIKYPLEI
jgi:hypothetical protein